MLFSLTGTSRTDTVCEPCAEGFYSSLYSKLAECAPHRQCARGDMVILNGSVYHDTVCGTCQDFASRGQLRFSLCVTDLPFNCSPSMTHKWVIHPLVTGETYRKVLSGVFSMQRIRISQMKKFIFRWVYLVSLLVVLWFYCDSAAE